MIPRPEFAGPVFLEQLRLEARRAVPEPPLPEVERGLRRQAWRRAQTERILAQPDPLADLHRRQLAAAIARRPSPTTGAA